MKDANFAGNARFAVDILGNEHHYNCMGCSISSGEITPPGGIIFEGNIVKLAADPEVPIPGFLVVNVKKHVNSFSEFTPEERCEIANVIAHASSALKQLNVTQTITIVQEERSRHFHLWIFPTHPWMIEKFGKGVEHLRAISDYAIKYSNKETVAEVLNVVEKVKKYFKTHNIAD